MLNSQATKAIVLDSSTQATILSAHSKSVLPIHSRLTFANFVLFGTNDVIVWGGAEKNSSNGLILAGDNVLVRRRNAKPMLCRLVQAMEDNDKLEIWSFWSDNVLVQCGHDLKRNETDLTFYEVDDVHGVNDFLILRDAEPEITGWKRSSRILVTCGSSPSLAVFRISSGSNDGKTLLAVAAASAITSVVTSFARKWLMSSPTEDDENDITKHDDADEDEEKFIKLWPRVTFGGDERDMLTLTRGHLYCASRDALGRVFLFHPLTLQIFRVFKGYRSPEIIFQQIDVDSVRGSVVELVLLHSEVSRGNVVEMWLCEGGDADRPFATAIIPVGSRLVDDATGTRIGLVMENDFLGELDVDVDPQDIEWERHLTTLRESFGRVDVQTLVDSLPSTMLEQPETLVRKLVALESSGQAPFGLDLYMKLLEKSNGDNEDRGIATKTSLLRALHKVLSMNNWMTWKDNLVETRIDNPRRWALEVTLGEKTQQSVVRGPSGDLAGSLLNDDPIPHVFFDALLCGDVFQLKELETTIKQFFARDKIVHHFVNWWLSRPVERSPAWTNSSATGNSLLRMALSVGLHDEPAALEDADPRGRLRLARAAMLSRAVAMTAKSPEWTQIAARMDRAFRVCILIDSDDCSLKSSETKEFVLKVASETCVHYGQPAPSSLLEEDSTTSNATDDQPFWVRPTKPLAALRAVPIFESAEARDQFRLLVFKHSLSLGDFSLAFIAAREMEKENPESLAFDATRLIAETPGGGAPSFFRLLMYLWKDTPLKRDAVNTLIIAHDLQNATALWTEVRNLLHKRVLLDTDLSEIAQRVFQMKLSLGSAVDEDDESLRAQGRAMGLGEEVSRIVAVWHWIHGRDVRGNESYDLIADDTIRLSAAVEGLRICRARLRDFLRSARNDSSKARIIASLPPKTISWLASAVTNDGLAVVQAPLRTTHSILLRIHPALPSEKSKEASSAVSPSERCSQLVTFIETLLDTSESL